MCKGRHVRAIQVCSQLIKQPMESRVGDKQTESNEINLIHYQ